MIGRITHLWPPRCTNVPYFVASSSTRDVKGASQYPLFFTYIVHSHPILQLLVQRTNENELEKRVDEVLGQSHLSEEMPFTTQT
jgi:hypothetical protein